MPFHSTNATLPETIDERDYYPYVFNLPDPAPDPDGQWISLAGGSNVTNPYWDPVSFTFPADANSATVWADDWLSPVAVPEPDVFSF